MVLRDGVENAVTAAKSHAMKTLSPRELLPILTVLAERLDVLKRQMNLQFGVFPAAA